MTGPRTTRLRVLRGVALAAAAAPMGAAWFVASCVLADPPASLPVLPPAAPQILTGSTAPPQGVFTNWSGGLNFVVGVQVQNPTEGVKYALVEDDTTATATLLTQPSAQANPSNGGPISIMAAAMAPGDGNCHTYTLYVDSADDHTWSVSNAVPASVTCDPSLCVQVPWTYAPPGSGPTCPMFDAGGQSARDASPTQ